MFLTGRALAVWLGLALLANVNGALRQGLLLPLFGERRAHLVSTLVLCTLVFALAWLTIRWI